MRLDPNLFKVERTTVYAPGTSYEKTKKYTDFFFPVDHILDVFYLYRHRHELEVINYNWHAKGHKDLLCRSFYSWGSFLLDAPAVCEGEAVHASLDLLDLTDRTYRAGQGSHQFLLDLVPSLCDYLSHQRLLAGQKREALLTPLQTLFAHREEHNLAGEKFYSQVAQELNKGICNYF